MCFPKLLIIIVLTSVAASATPIRYAFTTIASGTVGSTSFTNQEVTVTVNTDTNSISGTPPNQTSAPLSGATIAISTIGSGVLNQPITVSGVPTMVGFASGANTFEFNSAGILPNYDLRTSLGPVLALLVGGQIANLQTTLGTLALSSSSHPSFTATLSPPHPPRDFRGIGRSDELMYALQGGQAYTALSNGDGTYQYVPNLFSSDFDILRTGDFDGDGKADLILYRTNFGCFFCTSTVAYMGLSNGDGTFTFQSLFWRPHYQAVEMGDIDGNGKTDVVLFDGQSLDIGLGNGNRGFNYVHYLVLDAGFHFLRLADVNNDGKADLLFYDGTYLLTGISNGDGTFAFYPSYVGTGYDTIAIGYLNGAAGTAVFLYNRQTGAATTGISNGYGLFSWRTTQLSPNFDTVRIADGNLILYDSYFTGLAYLATGGVSSGYSLFPMFWGRGYDFVEVQDFGNLVLYRSVDGTSYYGRWIPNTAPCVIDVPCVPGAFGFTYSLWPRSAFLVDEYLAIAYATSTSLSDFNVDLNKAFVVREIPAGVVDRGISPARFRLVH